MFIKTAKTTVLSAKAYTVDVELNYNNGVARSKSFNGLADVSWGLNGTASCDGATINLGSLGSAAGDTNTSVGAAVQDAVDAAGACAVGSRYDATLTVNAKSTDITVTSGYKVTAADGSNDRLGLETSDSL